MQILNPVVELRGIRKCYPGNVTEAVAGVDLIVGRGEFISLLGPSGCGKTTTLRMLAGFERPSAGQIIIEGRDVSQVAPRWRNLGVVFQNYALFPHRTVAENIAFGLEVRKVHKAEISTRVARYLDLVQLRGFSNRLPATLSGGQQQRVALARALITEPTLLLLDEPFGALDRKLREQMQFELKQTLVSLGMTAVFVTHDQEEAMSMSDRIAVMSGGRIEQVDSPAQLYDHPISPFVASFIGKSSAIVGRLESKRATDFQFVSKDIVIPVDRSIGETGEGVIFVRPEAVRIAADRSKGATEAVIEFISYSGPVINAQIRVGQNTRLAFIINRDSAHGQMKVGDRLYVSISLAGVSFFNQRQGMTQ